MNETKTGQDESQVVMDSEEVLATMPHRFPFLLVDRVTEIELGKRIVGIKNVTINEPFFQGHFPGKPVMPGVLILEALAQLSGIMLLQRPEDKGRLALFMAIDKARFRKMVRPGDQLRLETEVVRIKGPLMRTKSRALVDGQVACEAELMFQVIDEKAK